MRNMSIKGNRPFTKKQIHGMHKGLKYLRRLNKPTILKENSDTIDRIEFVTALYSYLLLGIKNGQEAIEDRKKIFIINYLVPIINTFDCFRILFENGLYIQIQVLIRSQMEFMNNFFALTGDEAFFNHFSKVEEKNKTYSKTITPKVKHTEKAIYRVIKSLYEDIKDANLAFNNYTELKNELYQDLSETAHGNITRIIIQGLNLHDDEHVTPGLGGQIGPHPFGLQKINESLIFFQIIFRYIFMNLERLGYINKDSPEYENFYYYVSFKTIY